MSIPFDFRISQMTANGIDLTVDQECYEEEAEYSPSECASAECTPAQFPAPAYASGSSGQYQTNAIDLSVKGSEEEDPDDKRFYCPAEGCVFSKGMGKSFKKKMLVDQVIVAFINCIY
jgi:hypothetical protein